MPIGVSEEVVNDSAKFRSRESVPTLSYYHQKTQVMDIVHIGLCVSVYLLNYFCLFFVYLSVY